MRIYKENGKIFAELNETLEICDSNMNGTLQTYKEALLDRISKRFDQLVTEEALESMSKHER